MRPKTKQLKKLLKQAPSLEEQVGLLKDSYKGESCYILTAGPSIGKIEKSFLKKFLADKLVIAIKQTCELVEETADFHLINEYNFQRYDIHEDTIKIKLKSARRLFTPGYNADVQFGIDRQMLKQNITLAETREYEKYRIENKLERPLGSGIMHELGVYLPDLLGVDKIYMIGWDIGSLKTDQIVRYYEKVNWLKTLEKEILNRSPNFYNQVFMRVKNMINFFMFVFLRKNVKINIPGVRSSESKMIADSTGDLYKWFQERNIEAFIVSDSSLCDPAIPRVQLHNV